MLKCRQKKKLLEKYPKVIYSFSIIASSYASAYPCCSQAREGERHQYTETNHVHLESPIILICMFLDCGRLMGYPEGIHACTGRTF